MHRNSSPTLLVIAAMAAMAAPNCGAPPVDVTAETDSLRARSEEAVAAEAAQDVEAVLAFWAEDAIV